MPATTTPKYVLEIIDKAAKEEASFLDLGNCGLMEVQEAPIKELNFPFCIILVQ